MPHEQVSILDTIRMLIEGTKNGKIRWEPESEDGDAFRATFGNTGGVRISSLVTFSSVADSGGLLLELLDPQERSVFQFRPQTPQQHPPLQELFRFAREQGLNLDHTLDALLEEIRKRSEKQ